MFKHEPLLIYHQADTLFNPKRLAGITLTLLLLLIWHMFFCLYTHLSRAFRIRKFEICCLNNKNEWTYFCLNKDQSLDRLPSYCSFPIDLPLILSVPYLSGPFRSFPFLSVPFWSFPFLSVPFHSVLCFLDRELFLPFVNCG